MKFVGLRVIQGLFWIGGCNRERVLGPLAIQEHLPQLSPVRSSPFPHFVDLFWYLVVPLPVTFAKSAEDSFQLCFFALGQFGGHRAACSSLRFASQQVRRKQIRTHTHTPHTHTHPTPTHRTHGHTKSGVSSSFANTSRLQSLELGILVRIIIFGLIGGFGLGFGLLAHRDDRFPVLAAVSYGMGSTTL